MTLQLLGRWEEYKTGFIYLQLEISKHTSEGFPEEKDGKK